MCARCDKRVKQKMSLISNNDNNNDDDEDFVEDNDDNVCQL